MRCEICGKTTVFGNKVAHKPNVHCGPDTQEDQAKPARHDPADAVGVQKAHRLHPVYAHPAQTRAGLNREKAGADRPGFSIVLRFCMGGTARGMARPDSSWHRAPFG